jgi:hypothetical protein
MALADVYHAVVGMKQYQASVSLSTVDAGPVRSQVLTEEESPLLQPRESECAASELNALQYLVSIHILLEAPLFSNSCRTLSLDQHWVGRAHYDYRPGRTPSHLIFRRRQISHARTTLRRFLRGIRADWLAGLLGSMNRYYCMIVVRATSERGMREE